MKNSYISTMKKINNFTKKWVKDLGRHLSKDDGKWLTSIWKDAQRYYQRNVSPNHNEIISHPFGWLLLNKNKIEDKKSWQEWRKIGSLVQYGWACKVAELLWQIVWWFLKKIKNRIAISSINPGEGNGNPFQYSCLVNPMDRGTW